MKHPQQRYGVEEIAKSLQSLVHAILKREYALMCSCPTMPDKEFQEAMADVEKADMAVEESLKEFRDVTEGRFEDYDDDELTLSTFLFVSIWHNARAVAVHSHRLGDLIGRDKPERLAKLLLRLSAGASPVCRFVELRWDSSAAPSGAYRFRIKAPQLIQRLIFGCAVEMT